MAENANKLVGARLRTARKINKFRSAKAFSEHIDVPFTTYSQHESGARSMSTSSLIKYCKELSVSADWLLLDLGQLHHSDLETLDSDFRNKEKLLVIKDKEIMTVNIKLYSSILLEYMKYHDEISLSPDDILEFCNDIYNNLIVTSADDATRQKMIKLSISSLLVGVESEANKKTIPNR